MKRVLVVGGESRAHQGVFLGLSRADCAPLLAPDMPTAAQMLAAERIDLVALDLGSVWGSKELKGFLALVKDGEKSLPVLGLLPTPDQDDAGDFANIEDFVLPPYRPSEIALRVRHLLRRAAPQTDAEIIRVGPLVIDLARYEATLDGKRLDLTYKEYELLRFLASTPGNVFTRETLLNKVWGYDYFGGTRTVDVHIRRLRSKIEDTYSFIETVRNVGYKFKDS